MRKLAFLVLGIVAAAGGCDATDRDEPELPFPTTGVTTQQLEAFDALEAGTQQRWAWLQHEELRTPQHLSTARTGARVLRADEDAHVRTLAVLRENKALFRMRDPSVELSAKKTEADDLGMSHARFQQMVHGIPVVGAEVMAHYDREGRLASVDANYVPDLELDVNPRFAAGDALAAAKRDVLARSAVAEHLLEPDDGRLVVHAARLAWEYRVRALAASPPAIWVVTIDAQTGDVLHRRNDLQTVTAKGTGVLGDTKTFEVGMGGSGYVMDDDSTGVSIQTFSAEQQEVAPGDVVTSTSMDTWDTGAAGKGAAVDAHVNATAVAKYYKTIHNRNAIDGVGGALQSTVHFGKAFDNAAWIQTGMIYGDGGQLFLALSVSLDVVAHEFTHGITEKTSNLAYENQSGALNEAVSDILGCFIEHWAKPDADKNWKLGEIVTKSGVPLRDMKNPLDVSDPQPTHMQQFVQTQQDEGGVHINSGIINNTAYLMTVGGTNSVSKITVKSGIGWEKSEKLWYRANTKYFMATTNFAGAAAALKSAGTDIGLTQNELNIVDCAFKATGVIPGACATVQATPTTPKESTDEDEAPAKTTKKKRAVTTETGGCSSTGTPGDAGLFAALVGLAVVAGRRKKTPRA